MPKGTQRPPVRLEDRLALLERELTDLRYRVANLLRPKPRAHWSQVRLARTIDDGAYGITAQRFPIVFLDAAWDTVGSEVDLTAKSAETQAYAIAVEPMTLPVGTHVFVEQTEKGAWVIVNAAEGLGIGETQAGGIVGEAGSGTVTAKVLNSDGTLSTALDDESNPIEEEVYSPLGTVAENRIVVYGRDKRSGRLFIVSEKCPA